MARSGMLRMAAQGAVLVLFFAFGPARVACARWAIGRPAPSAASSACSRIWTPVDVPHVGTDNLLGVASTSESDVWAVGYTGTSEALIEHWDGSAWKVAPSPSVPQSALASVAAVSLDDAWAVGTRGSIPNPFGEHWDGVGWTLVPLPFRSDSDTWARGVTAVSSDDVWAVGAVLGDSGSLRPLTWHWDGKGWHEVASPPVEYGNLVAVTAISSTDVGAVGSYYEQLSETLTEHWDGQSWSVVPSPNFGTLGSWLTGVAEVGSDDVWAVGSFYPNGAGTKSLTEHWDGSTWTAVRGYWDPSGANGLYGVAARSATDLWAVGSRTADSHETATMVGRWDGVDWRLRRSRNVGSAPQLFGVTVTADGFGWAVGSQGTATGGSLVERACGI
jgi:hypothetical protein